MPSDYFSRQAAVYAVHRPTYPAALFAYLAGLVAQSRLAWDCATGNGQAAVGLADWFEHVVATDASASQIAHALPHPSVEYRVASAEASGLPDASVDLVAVAQALHWFDLDAFFAEARRVLAPGGVFAAWSYGSASIDDPSLDAVLTRFEHETVGPYWPPERRLVDEGYRSIVLPFRELTPPPFILERTWTLTELAGYLRTWSATGRYADEHRRDPVVPLEEELGEAWGDPAAKRTIRWPLTLRVGVAPGYELAARD